MTDDGRLPPLERKTEFAGEMLRSAQQRFEGRAIEFDEVVLQHHAVATDQVDALAKIMKMEKRDHRRTCSAAGCDTGEMGIGLAVECEPGVYHKLG
jgi:hypothetical protein